MELFEAIDSRASAARLMEPGPDRRELQRLIAAAVRAPDHGRLAPWRFVVLQGSGRNALGAAMAQVFRARNPEATDSQLEIQARKVQRAPVIVVVSTRPVPSPKVPEVEQISATAAAIQNMILAAHAMGYGAQWKTGAAAYADEVKGAVGLEPEDRIVGFIYLGTIASAGTARPARSEGLVTWRDVT